MQDGIDEKIRLKKEQLSSRLSKKEIRILKKKSRGIWWFRTMSSVMDVFILGFIMTPFQNEWLSRGIALYVIFPSVGLAYYLISEIKFGRTVGKWLLGYRLLSKDGVSRPKNTLIIIRAILRFILGPLCILSWRRVTLLDLLSKTRVCNTSASKREVRSENNVSQNLNRLNR